MGKIKQPKISQLNLKTQSKVELKLLDLKTFQRLTKSIHYFVVMTVSSHEKHMTEKIGD